MSIIIPVYSLAVLPSSTSFLASVGDWSIPFFADLLPFVIFACGLFIAVFLAGWILHSVGSLFHR